MIHDIRGILCLQKDGEGNIWMTVSHDGKSASLNISVVCKGPIAYDAWTGWAEALIAEAEQPVSESRVSRQGCRLFAISLPKIKNEIVSQAAVEEEVSYYHTYGHVSDIIVEQIGFQAYRLRKGHAAVAALRQLGHLTAVCYVFGKYTV